MEINGKPEIIRKYSVSYVNDMEDLAKILSLFCYQIHESGVDGWSIICGFRQEKLEGETLSNKLYVHFYSDENLAFFGFQLSFVRKEGWCSKVYNEFPYVPVYVKYFQFKAFRPNIVNTSGYLTFSR